MVCGQRVTERSAPNAWRVSPGGPWLGTHQGPHQPSLDKTRLSLWLRDDSNVPSVFFLPDVLCPRTGEAIPQTLIILVSAVFEPGYIQMTVCLLYLFLQKESKNEAGMGERTQTDGVSTARPGRRLFLD
jgi:hypothetical protein